MATSAGGRNRAVPYINVTPLIDVLLVVLIIFMVVTPLKPSRFKADIPTQRDPNENIQNLKPNPLTLVVSISTDLQIKLNQDVMGSVNDPSALAAKLQQVFQQRKEQRADCSRADGAIRRPSKRLRIRMRSGAAGHASSRVPGVELRCRRHRCRDPDPARPIA